MREMGISEFKAHALRIIDEVYENRDRIIITRRGNPVAEVIPYQGSADTAGPTPGRLEGVLVYEEDIVSPLGPDPWEAAR